MSAPVPRCADFNNFDFPAKHALPTEQESQTKRLRTDFSGFRGRNRALSAMQPASNLPGQVTPSSTADVFLRSTAGAGDFSNAVKVDPTGAAPEKAKAKATEIELLPADYSLAPSSDLNLKINSKKHTAYAGKSQYLASSEEWLDYSGALAELKGHMIKPKPKGGDVGIPATQDEIDELAKKVYDAIVDFRYVYGTQKAPVSSLLRSDVKETLIIKRSYDLVNAMIDFHKNGISATLWSNGLNITNNAFKMEQLKRENEQNDTFEDRMTHIIAALRYHKIVAMDVITDKETLMYAIILAPKAKLMSKFLYAESNADRARLSKAAKEKAKAFDESLMGKET
jgi:hypothetical protein